MRHVIVTRVTALLSGLFLAAAMLFAWLATTADVVISPAAATPQTEGGRLFEARCAACHTADTLRPAFQDLTDGRRQEIEAFLGHHGEAPPDDDRAIMEYLARKNPRPPD